MENLLIISQSANLSIMMVMIILNRLFQKNLGQSTNNKQKIKQSGIPSQIITNMYNEAKKENKYL